ALEKQEAQVQKLKAENETLQEYLETNKRSILKQAKDDAKAIISGANKLIENTISEIRESDAEKERTRALRQKLKKERENLEEHAPNQKTSSQLDSIQGSSLKEVKKAGAQQRPLAVGDWVRIKDTGTEAEVIELAKNNVILAMGELRTVQKLKNLERLDRKETRQVQRKSGSRMTRDASNFSPEIDVRGMRTETALNEIEKVLDQAIMLGYPNLKIVHGKGDGILRRFIREYLRKYSEISHMEDEHADRGGDGITYAYLH
ncbi:MAG TPA: Smr/MutS family protein, partial [Sphingobacteriaceae bacterium]|nr:Smr/MutS family protein [Sphingobacteriaceae bacterium]